MLTAEQRHPFLPRVFQAAALFAKKIHFVSALYLYINTKFGLRVGSRASIRAGYSCRLSTCILARRLSSDREHDVVGSPCWWCRRIGGDQLDVGAGIDVDVPGGGDADPKGPKSRDPDAGSVMLQRPVGQMPWTRGPKASGVVVSRAARRVRARMPSPLQKSRLLLVVLATRPGPCDRRGQISLHSGKFSNARIRNSTMAITRTVKLFPVMVSGRK